MLKYVRLHVLFLIAHIQIFQITNSVHLIANFNKLGNVIIPN